MVFDTILVPTGGKEPAKAAARRGFELATKLGATVHIISVIDSGLVTSATYVGDSQRIRERLRDHAETRTAALAEDARERGLNVEIAVRRGTPAEEIVDYAAENGIDVIVIGTRKRSLFERLVFGSITDKVVRTAPVPVLIVSSADRNTNNTSSEDDS